jgi:ATP-dependent RNA helicase RhlE
MKFERNNYSEKRGKQNQRQSRPSNQSRNKQPVSTLDPKLFVKKAVPLNEARYESSRTILDLPVDRRIIANLLAKGYSKPTEIQDRTLEALLAQNNLLGIAQTGTGKTGAFLIPIVHSLINTKAANQVLIVVPTRELAVQVEQEFQSMVKGLGMRATVSSVAPV